MAPVESIEPISDTEYNKLLLDRNAARESITVPEKETRLVRVVYDEEQQYPSEALGVLAPNDEGEQTLFVHTHLAQKGALPYIERVEDAKTGETIRVSASWLGDKNTFWD